MKLLHVLTSLFILLLMAATVMAQVPQKMNYQAVARDGSGEILSDQGIGMQINVRQYTSEGVIVYRERHFPTTNAFGLVNLVIGDGLVVQGTMDGIDWADGPYYIQIEVDPDGGANYIDMGTTELLSVPYALYAGNGGGQPDNDNDPANELQVLEKNGNMITLSQSGGSVVDEVDDMDNDPSNEIQILNLQGTQLSLSQNGGTVSLPTTGGSIWNLNGNNAYYTDGYVGIGVDNPQAPLHLRSGLLIVDSMGNEMIGMETGNGYAGIGILNTNGNLSASITNFFGGTGALMLFDSQEVEKAIFGLSFADAGFATLSGTNRYENVIIAHEFFNTNMGLVATCDTNGFYNTLMGANPDGGGFMASYGPDGTRNFIVGHYPDYPDYGYLAIHNNADNPMIELSVSPGKSGYINMFGTNGKLNMFIGPGNNANRPYWSMHDDDGDIMLEAEGTNEGAGWLATRGPNEYGNTFLSFLDGRPGYGFIAASNNSGQDRGQLFTDFDDAGSLWLGGSNNSSNAVLSYGEHPDVGYFGIFDRDDYESVMITTTQNASPYQLFFSPTGNNLVALYGYDDYVEHGGIQVFANGIPRIGLVTETNGTGTVYADQKFFRMDHPTEPGKEIRYGCVEGPELAAYIRGTATLNNGEVAIEFPDHFKHVINPGTMTVILTPLSADSKGLAVTARDIDGMSVKELFQGTGNYSFDWEVKAVRKGYEHFEPVRDKVEYGPATLRSRQKGRHAQGAHRESKIELPPKHDQPNERTKERNYR